MSLMLLPITWTTHFQCFWSGVTKHRNGTEWNWMRRNDPEWTGMNRNGTGIDRNDTGMIPEWTGIDRNDKGIEWNTQITLTATRVDQKRGKSVVHVIGNNMSHISIAMLFSGKVSVIAYFSPKELRADASAQNGTVMSLWRHNRELKHRR